MSIETLKADLQSIIKSTAFGSTENVETFLINVRSLITDQLFPWLENVANEIGELDETVEDIVHQTAEVLHSDTSDMFAAVIAGAAPLMLELEKRAAGEPGVLNAIKEWRELANEASQVLDDITIPDPVEATDPSEQAAGEPK
jgi:hypothetical protein